MLNLVKLLAMMAVTVFLLSRKWDLGLILVLNAILAALLFAYPLRDLPLSLWRGLVAPDTINLALAVFLVLVLAEVMQRTKAMERLATSLQALAPDGRFVVALLPLLVGLMPMLGGAMFSAPMVNEVGDTLKLGPNRKTFINYWFRHSMEYVFPLYSSLLMIAALLQITVYDFIRVSWPLALAALAGGTLWGLLGVPAQPHSRNGQRKLQLWLDLLSGIWPLILVILSVVVLKFNMIFSLLAVVGLALLVWRVAPRQWPDIARRSFPIHTFSAIFGVMIFKRVLEDAGAVQQIPQALSLLGLPPLLVAFVVPLMVGLLTGVAAATLAISVPLVLPLLSVYALDSATAGLWLFVGGFSGILLSPMHLCLTLTREYFGAQWGQLYRAIIPSVGLVAATALVIVWMR
ncbi:MAG: DUF401 family protein [Anaerolineae bacterium]|nr:DUF401 family protein [Anaerolineae bacterium]